MNYKNAIKDIDGQIKQLEEARKVLLGLSGGRRKGRSTMSAAGDGGLPRLNANGGRRFGQRKSNRVTGPHCRFGCLLNFNRIICPSEK
jgi:hypothetical protein